MKTTKTPRRFATVARGLVIVGASFAFAGPELANARMAGVIDLTRPNGQTSALVRGPGLTVIRNGHAKACASGGYLERQRCGERPRRRLSTLVRPGSQPPVVEPRDRVSNPTAPVRQPAMASAPRPEMDEKVALAKRSTLAAMGGRIDCTTPDARFWKECTGVAPLAPVAPTAEKPATVSTHEPTPEPCRGAFWGMLPCPQPNTLGEVLAGDPDAPDAPEPPDTPEPPDPPSPPSPPGACDD